MSIGKILIFVIFTIVIVVGISIALSKSSGTFSFQFDPDNPFIRSLFWFSPNTTDKKEFVKKDVSKINKVQVKNNIEKTNKKPIPPTGFTEKDLSPFWGDIQIKKITPANPSNYSRLNGFTLIAQKTVKNPISITGWKLRGNRNTEIYIPEALADYGYSGAGTAQNINLKAGDYAVFYSTRNPGIRNFRLNKCTGYLNSFLSFSPQLPKNCPKPYTKNELALVSGQCQNFIRSLSNCSIPTADQKNRFSQIGNNPCRQLLDRFMYGYCYDNHRNDPDFFSHEWRIWLGISMPFDYYHDRVLLMDESGFLVDEYVY